MARAKLAVSSESISEKKKRGGNPQNVEPHKWQPGQSGNPSGRPSKLRTLISDAIGDSLSVEADGHTHADIIGAKIVREAMAGDNWLAAAKEAIDRTEGKPPQAVKIDANIEHRSADDRLSEIIADLVARAAKGSATPPDGETES